MPHPSSDPPTISLPRWVYVAASVAILFHFGSVGVRVLAAFSGPWPAGEAGSAPLPPPKFANTLAESLPGDYLKLLHLDRDYHFESDQPRSMSVKLVVRLKDGNNETSQTLTFPEEGANFWVRHRQQLMAHLLANDQMAPTPQSKVVAPSGGAEETMTLWEEIDPSGRNAQLFTKSVNDIKQRGMAVRVPTGFSMAFLHAYSRYLSRQHGAKWVEISRVEQDPVPPDVLFTTNLPSMMFEPRTFNYGEATK